MFPPRYSPLSLHSKIPKSKIGIKFLPRCYKSGIACGNPCVGDHRNRRSGHYNAQHYDSSNTHDMTAPCPDAVLHLAALHTLAAAGFASTSRAASLSLSTTLSRYLRLVAVTCTERASLAGRTKIAAIDVLQALEELGIGGIGELQEWTVGLDQEVSLNAPGLISLGQEVREGLVIEDGITRLKMVPDDQIGVLNEDEDEDEEESMEEDEGEDMDDGMEVEEVVPKRLRFDSPDWSWLPPLPSDQVSTTQSSLPVPTQTTHADHTSLTAPAGSLSIIDRYRRKIPYSQSQLSENRPFIDPPRPTQHPPLPPPQSSFPALQTAYAATKNEPTIALRQTALRQQASDLLRRTIASPDQFQPKDTLILPLSGPKISPIIPSFSTDESIPHRSIPIISNPDGILSRLVHEIKSPHLPPPLRERLTSVRPPVPLMKDGQPILYGPEIKGPSRHALLKAQGKHAEAEKLDKGLLQATWPTPSKGIDRFSQKLTIPRNALNSGIGEDRPRVPKGNRKVETPSVNLTEPDDSGASTNKIKFKVSAPSPSITITNDPMERADTFQKSISPNPHSPHTAPTPTLSSSPNPNPGLKLKLGVKKPTDPTGGQDQNHPMNSPSSLSPSTQPTRPMLSLKLSSRSISPYKPSEGDDRVKTERK